MAEKPGGLLDADNEHPGSHRVQRPGVADPAGAGQSADARHDIMRGQSCGLVHNDEPALAVAQLSPTVQKSRGGPLQVRPRDLYRVLHMITPVTPGYVVTESGISARPATSLAVLGGAYVVLVRFVRFVRFVVVFVGLAVGVGVAGR